ncbi:MAG: carbohydrate porin [Roseibium sp.]
MHKNAPSTHQKLTKHSDVVRVSTNHWRTVFLGCLLSNTLIIPSAVSQDVAGVKVNEETLSQVGPPVAGRYEPLTDQIFPTSYHHLSDELSFAKYYNWKRKLSADHGFDFWILNSPIAQVGSTDGQTYLDNELDIFFNWRLLDNEDTVGKFFFWGLYVQTFTDKPSGAFAASQGLFTFPNGGATDPDKHVIAPSALWWEQTFNNVGLTYRLGQLYAPSLWGTNSYLGDDRATFMNTALSNPQGTPWSGGSRGLGAMASVGNDTVYAAAGFQDAKGDQSSIDFESFADGQFSYLGELGWTPTFGEGLNGTYKATAGYVGKTGNSGAVSDTDGWGLVISAEQDLTDRFSVFGVFRKSWGKIINNTEMTAAGGIMVNGPFNFSDDQIGFGGFFAKPYDTQNGTLQDEFGLEAFWRFQLTPRLDFTPDAQLYIQPGRVSEESPVGVFGLRARYVL